MRVFLPHFFKHSPMNIHTLDRIIKNMERTLADLRAQRAALVRQEKPKNDQLKNKYKAKL